ncbi:hypothetical protein, partial [uncultured Dubosiella sp.]|uniref:hypothetical protein n=1 Tax=uncultured Dubosiella sp. TaxID=1937011 RepID=UPI0027320686
SYQIRVLPYRIEQNASCGQQVVRFCHVEFVYHRSSLYHIKPDDAVARFGSSVAWNDQNHKGTLTLFR